MLSVVAVSALNSSALWRSLQGFLWFLRDVKGEMISSFLDGPVSMLRSSSAPGISGSSSSVGAVEDFLEMFDPSCFLVFLRSEKLPLLISYWYIPVAAVFPKDQSGDFIDIPLLPLSRYFLSLLYQLRHRPSYLFESSSWHARWFLNTPPCICLVA